MKIREQLRLFIIAVVSAPVLTVLFIFLFRHINSPDRMVIQGYKQFDKLSDLPVTEQDISILREALKAFPPEVEFMVTANHKEIVFTNMEEFKKRRTIDDPSLFYYMRETSQRYFYQLVTPPIENQEVDLLLITRVDREHEGRSKDADHFSDLLLIFLVLFESVSLAFIFTISHTISSSITVIENRTESIARGDLDEPVERRINPRASNEITSLIGNVEKMRIALKDTSEKKTAFIMGISHDLRTPVAVIKGYIEAMQDGIITPGDEMDKSLEIVRQKTESLETMINTLINFVKLDTTDWRQQLKKQKIEPVIQDFIKSSIATGGVFKRNITGSVSMDKDLELPFDSLLFQRALQNLFQNAMRYTEDGADIDISAVQSKDELMIKVEDSGIGIEKKDLQHIFEMFYRGTNSRRESGMGIGLSVVKNIINTHGWKINVNSQKGVGTAFIITIPLRRHSSSIAPEG